MQSPPEIMKDGLCPAMLMPSKACKEMSTNETWFCFEAKTSAVNMDHLLPPTTVTRRCLPALGTLKGGVVVVGNETILDAGEGTTVQASDVLEASKWVLPAVCWQRSCTVWMCDAGTMWYACAAGFSLTRH